MSSGNAPLGARRRRRYRLEGHEADFDPELGEHVDDDSTVEGTYRYEGDQVRLDNAPVRPMLLLDADQLAPGEALFQRAES